MAVMVSLATSRERERQIRDEKMAWIKKAQHVVKQTYR